MQAVASQDSAIVDATLPLLTPAAGGRDRWPRPGYDLEKFYEVFFQRNSQAMERSLPNTANRLQFQLAAIDKNLDKLYNGPAEATTKALKEGTARTVADKSIGGLTDRAAQLLLPSFLYRGWYDIREHHPQDHRPTPRAAGAVEFRYRIFKLSRCCVYNPSLLSS